MGVESWGAVNVVQSSPTAKSSVTSTCVVIVLSVLSCCDPCARALSELVQLRLTVPALHLLLFFFFIIIFSFSDVVYHNLRVV